MKNYLVTGGTGFIGSRLCEILQNLGHTFTLITNSTYLGEYKHITAHDFSKLNTLEKFDGVFHLATHFNGERIPDSEEYKKILKANIEFSALLAHKLYELNIQNVVIADSFTQYNLVNGDHPANFYSISKNLSNEIFDFLGTDKFNLINLVIPDTYGPRDNREKLFKYLASSIKRQLKVELSPGNQLVDYLYVDDVCLGLISAMELISDNIQNTFIKSKYRLSSLEVITLKELINTLNLLIGEKLVIEWGAKKYREGEIFKESYLHDLLPDWQPSVHLNEGLRKTFSEFL
jgi:CDP-paratose synthetase